MSIWEVIGRLDSVLDEGRQLRDMERRLQTELSELAENGNVYLRR